MAGEDCNEAWGKGILKQHMHVFNWQETKQNFWMFNAKPTNSAGQQEWTASFQLSSLQYVLEPSQPGISLLSTGCPDSNTHEQSASFCCMDKATFPEHCFSAFCCDFLYIQCRKSCCHLFPFVCFYVLLWILIRCTVILSLLAKTWIQKAPFSPAFKISTLPIEVQGTSFSNLILIPIYS